MNTTDTSPCCDGTRH